jgi:repressor LexA
VPRQNTRRLRSCRLSRELQFFCSWLSFAQFIKLVKNTGLELITAKMLESTRSPRTTARLTPRQQEILDLVKNAIATTGAPPTRAEIASQLGFRSVNAAEEHLQALARKGAIELVSGTSRGIRIRSTEAGNPRGVKQFTPPLAELRQLVLPLIGRVAAGSPILAEQHIEQTYQLERSLFQRQPDYLLKVRGMSMRDAGIVDGDLLAVQSTRSAHNGQIVVARLGEDVTVKRFFRTPHGVELRPENPDFSVIQVSPDDSFDIEGLAVGLIRGAMPL